MHTFLRIWSWIKQYYADEYAIFLFLAVSYHIPVPKQHCFVVHPGHCGIGPHRGCRKWALRNLTPIGTPLGPRLLYTR